MSKLLLRERTRARSGEPARQVADVLMSDGLIAEIGRESGRTGAEVFDATGMIVAPGIHRHARASARARIRTCGDDRERIARRGGRRIHFRLLHAEYETGERQRDGHELHPRSGAPTAPWSTCSPIGAITKGSEGEELAAIGSMKAAGVVAISDDGRPVMNARVMRRAMESREVVRPAGHQPLRRPEPERRRRHARGRAIDATRVCAAFRRRRKM